MAFRVKQTAEADHDLDLILEWLMARQAGETGLRWLEGLKDTIDSLTNLPHHCSLAPESVAFYFEVRQLLHGRKPHQYRVLFTIEVTIEADTVIILHIRHGRRLPLA